MPLMIYPYKGYPVAVLDQATIDERLALHPTCSMTNGANAMDAFCIPLDLAAKVAYEQMFAGTELEALDFSYMIVLREALFTKCPQDILEVILEHEIGHIVNGDMLEDSSIPVIELDGIKLKDDINIEIQADMYAKSQLGAERMVRFYDVMIGKVVEKMTGTPMFEEAMSIMTTRRDAVVGVPA